MADFVIPELGENIAGGDVVRVLVKPGDTLKKDQPVLELETDKATIEVPSSVAGVVKELEGQDGRQGEGRAGGADGGRGGAAGRALKPPPPKREQPAAPGRGKVPSAAVPKPPTRPPRSTRSSPARSRRRAKNRAKQQRRRRSSTSAAARRASCRGRIGRRRPRARRRRPRCRPRRPRAATARELGVDITQVEGTGPGGRISVDDVKAPRARRCMTGGGGGVARVSAAPLPDFSSGARSKCSRCATSAARRPSSCRRRGRRSRTSRSSTRPTSPSSRSSARSTRSRRKQAGGKLTITAIALKVIAAALKKFPQFNAPSTWPSESIVLKKYVHIGVAVDTDRGLLVPVIRDVDQQEHRRSSSVELARSSPRRPRPASSRRRRCRAASFTISNLGGIGGTYFTPIVNSPEVAILGMSRAVHRAGVERTTAFEPRLMLPLSLSYDHRVIDGADGVRFLRWVGEAFEQPFLMSL